MPTVDQIIIDVKDIIKDDSYGPTEITRRLNKCLHFIARKLYFSDLEGEDTVDTVVGVNVATLPSDFHFNLFDCWSDTHGHRVKVFDSRRDIDRHLDKLDSAGSVVGVSQLGRTLYYQRRPASAETLRIKYSKKPTDLAIGGALPVYVPDDLHDSLFTNFACWELFARIEDGVEGEKINTIYYKQEFYQALREAIIFFKPEPKLPYEITDHLVKGCY